MIHYSCDLCKRPLDPEDDLRYVVKLEVYAAFDPLEIDDDCDNLQEIHEILERMDDSASEEERMSSYVVRNGDSLYVDLQCLLNCTEEEAYMMGMCIESKRLLVQQYA